MNSTAKECKWQDAIINRSKVKLHVWNQLLRSASGRILITSYLRVNVIGFMSVSNEGTFGFAKVIFSGSG